ncbi:AAA family ATPase [Corynebacterium kefirresidentii]|jgi:hypothetical protein|uniref:AAA family ATPase n=2 Tax=Bacillati TaxID=1783272 RepID=UPI0003B8492B|nr:MULTISPECIES: AAA family ATPase [Corynebacterium]ERS45563.1 hypothetical protein HMPREF1286_02383 [Corynebacterium sp. KPL1860]ERS46024.1 hypothetical protein HMPREF1282_02361 [Corynebacterium sp. KPL1856]ERS52811.1 hypothetical protein HMPREF1264_02373 [Corynebacterium sp. KPL1821]ERS58271.1 hypothetical protein HMPREF1260_02364 [Corynebacterium sp. KPL1817]ERS76628.1 hypothetical protein HMPREF1283_02372 [Corynebacterium sp. KPL1857]
MKSSSSSEELLRPLNDAVEGLQDKFMDALPWVITVIMTAIVLWGAVPWLWRRAWYKENKAARRVQASRKTLGESFDLTIPQVRRDGSIRIAPGETSKWLRPGLEAELSRFLQTPIRLTVREGLATVKTPVRLPSSIQGKPQFSPKSGALVIGVDTTTGAPAEISLREKSGVILAGKPGSGKTFALKAIRHALHPYADITVFDGKRDNPEGFYAKALKIQSCMEERLSSGMDYWAEESHPQLLVLILDEVQRWFGPASRGKADKEAAAEREALIRDLVQRGRSAGVLVILTTQRMTADVVPTGIRDLCGVKAIGRVTRPEDAELVLGIRPSEGDPSPISAGPGQLVVDDEKNPLRMIQVYMPRA